MIPGCGEREPHLWRPGPSGGLCGECGLGSDDSVHDHDPEPDHLKRRARPLLYPRVITGHANG